MIAGVGACARLCVYVCGCGGGEGKERACVRV